jgi:histidine ammonia-lyase
MVVITGRSLSRAEVVRVARDHEPVELHRDARGAMSVARGVVDRALGRGDAVYGLTTGAGVLKRVALDEAASGSYANRLLRQHQVGLGADAPVDVVRAMILRQANEVATGRPGVRPDVADRLVAALNADAQPRVRTLGSVGQADLAQGADLALDLFADLPLAPGEGLALLTGNPFATGWAALALDDTATLLAAMEAAGALSLEAIVANPSLLHASIAEARPYPGLGRALTRLHALLDGSFLWTEGQARSLQDPLTFRNLPQILGATRDAFDHADAYLAIELNASQGNPIVVPSEDRLVSVANFEVLPLAAALDYLRIVLATALSASSERIVKMLDTPWSGLPTGLTSTAGAADPGLGYIGIASQAIAAEARLLAAPVSFEMASTAHAEGIEDRMTMAPLAARRLAEQVALGRQLVARELVVAAQAVELRGLAPQGGGTAAVQSAVRALVPFLGPDELVPSDLDPLAAAIEAGRLVPRAPTGQARGQPG